MSTFRNPVGPQSSKVYWRRRLVVGLGVLVAIFIVILIVLKPGGGATKPLGQTGVVSPTPSSTPVPSGSIISSPPSTGAACTPANVRVNAITDKTVYAATEKPLISMSITNTGSTPCTINAGSTQQVLEITSGTDVIWLSTDCQTSPVDAVVTLQPGKTKSTTPIPWDRTRSSKTTCTSTSRPAVPAGGASYHLSVKVGAIASTTTAQFILK